MLELGGFSVLAAPVEKDTLLIQTHTNSESTCEPAYTNYRFTVTDRGQTLEWAVIDVAGKSKKHIIVHQSPGASSFSSNGQLHRAIMRKIFSRWPISDFDSISFGCLGAPPDWSWSVAIAFASSRSDDYKDYRAHYPHSRISNLNGLFAALANSSDAYRPIREAFQEFGANIEVDGIEKVMAARAETLPFFSQLRAMGITGRTRVLYDAHGNGFAIKPRHSPQGAANGRQPFRLETNQTSATAASRHLP
jgi:hypothetical protein